MQGTFGNGCTLGINSRNYTVNDVNSYITNAFEKNKNIKDFKMIFLENRLKILYIFNLKKKHSKMVLREPF